MKAAREAKRNKKSFYTYISSRKKTYENVDSLLSRAGILVIPRGTEKVQVLSAFFSSVFIGKVCALASRSLSLCSTALQVWSSAHNRRTQNQGALNPLRHSGGTRWDALEGVELTNVIAMLLTLLKSHSSFKAGRLLMTTNRQTLHPSSAEGKKEHLGSYRLVSLTSVP